MLVYSIWYYALPQRIEQVAFSFYFQNFRYVDGNAPLVQVQGENYKCTFVFGCALYFEIMKILQCCILFIIFNIWNIDCKDVKHNDGIKASKITRRLEKVVSQSQPISEIHQSKPYNQNIKDKIVRGISASKGEFPWVVGIWRLKSSRPFCGGSILNSR